MTYSEGQQGVESRSLTPASALAFKMLSFQVAGALGSALARGSRAPDLKT